MRVPFASAAALVIALVASGCMGDNIVTPSFQPEVLTPTGTRLSAQFDTGSVPPPFNFTQMLDGEFTDNGLSVHYSVHYNVREQLAPGALQGTGYSPNDDLQWTDFLRGAVLKTWDQLVAATQLGPIPPLAHGANSFTVTLTTTDGHESTGVPTNRGAWEAAIREVDERARAAKPNPRSEP